jgi:two-component system, cell cycle response regulator
MLVNLKKSRILIVDDDPAIQNLLKGFYASYDVDLFEAVHGQQAIEMAPVYRPDLILLDIDMPVLNGYTTIAILRTHEATSDVPIILMTGQAEAKDKAKGLYDAYLGKPFCKDDLIQATLKFLPGAVKRAHDSGKGTVPSGSFN